MSPGAMAPETDGAPHACDLEGDMFSPRQCPSLYDNTGSLEKRRWLTRPVRQYRATLGAMGSDAFLGESLAESSFDGQLENVEARRPSTPVAGCVSQSRPSSAFRVGGPPGVASRPASANKEWDLAYARQVHHMIRADHDDHGLHAVVRLQLLAWVGQPRVLLITTGGMRYMRLHCRFDLLQLHVLRGGAASSSKTGEDRDAASFAKTWCPTQTNCRTLSAESQETQRCAAHAAFCEREDRGSQLSICGNRLDSTVSRRRPAARPTAVTQA
eukprot:s1218_g4.t1